MATAKQRRPRQRRYMSIEAFEAVKAYIEHAKAHQENPHHVPNPDVRLLLTDAAHGSIRRVESKTIEGQPLIGIAIWAKDFPDGRRARYLEPLDFAAVTLGTAFGLGVSVNDNFGGGKGLAYPRFRPRVPKNRAVHLLRVLTDAQPKEEARQCSEAGERTDYHIISRRWLSKRPYEATLAEGKKARVPTLGRQAFYEAAALYWNDNHEKAGIPVSLDDYLGLIRTALELADELAHSAES